MSLITITNPATAKFSWVDPSTNADGSALTPGELTGYTIGVGPSSGNYTQLTPVTPGTAVSEALSSLVTALAPNTTYFAAVRAESVNGPSAWSPELNFVIRPIPAAPTGFSLA